MCAEQALFLKMISCATMQWKPKNVQAENRGTVICMQKGQYGAQQSTCKNNKW